jgi:CBS domain-containing protein
MQENIAYLMDKKLVTVNLNDSAETVEKVMVSNHLSCVPVISSDGNCFGVISAPDLVQFHQARKNPMAQRAWEMCTHKIIEVSPDISIRGAAQLMLENNIHHLVVTEEDSVIGIISSLDIISGCLVPAKD